MTKGLKLSFLALAAAALLVSPLSAQVLTIPAGDDAWNTPASAGSQAYLSGSELDVLAGCGGHGDGVYAVKGKNLANGANTDTKVRRVSSVTFDRYGQQKSVDIYVSAMTLQTVNPVPTNCGTSLDLTFTAVPPDNGAGTSKMAITLDNSAGGSFDATIVVPVLVTAAQTGNSVGTVYTLPSAGPIPFSTTPPSGAVNPNGNFHPGAHPGGASGGFYCRGKWVPSARHCYGLAKKTCRGPSPIIGAASEVGIDPICIDDDIQPVDTEPGDIEPGDGTVIGN